MSLLKVAELYFGDYVVTYGELREFVRLTSGENDLEEILMDVDEGTGRIEAFRGYITKGD